MRDAERLVTLRAIRSFDPDGGTRPPTEADREEFRAWVVRTFGDDMWREYQRDDWDEGPGDWE